MQLSLQNFTALVQAGAAAAQGACAQLLDFTVGSVTRALMEAVSTVALWLQWMVLQVLSVTRAATSAGGDLDTWMADFGLTRLAATQATGTVTLSRFSTTGTVVVPAGGQLKTADGSQAFIITGGPYTLNPGVATVDVSVQAMTPGQAGNVGAGTITLLASSIPGIDTCSNALAFTNGINAESDPAFRLRFALYINSRTSGTLAAVDYAALSVQQGVTVSVQPNVPVPGNFYVTIDDGTGAPSPTLIAEVTAAIALVAPIGSSFTVLGPTIYGASISITLTTQLGANHPAIVGEVNAAVPPFVNTLPVGGTLYYTKLASIIYAVDASITNVRLLINGATVDLVPPTQTNVVKLSSLAVA